MTDLHVPAWAWAVTIAAVVFLVTADLLVSSRRNRAVRLSEAAWWTLATVGLAVGFGALLAANSGGAAAGQFFAGWLTEYSLSLDNLLVFMILISRSRVPRHLQSRVVLGGILVALLLRGVFIALGAAALHKFDWVEYLFGAFLIYTAAEVAARRRLGDSDDPQALLSPAQPATPPQPASRPAAGQATGGHADSNTTDSNTTDRHIADSNATDSNATDGDTGSSDTAGDPGGAGPRDRLTRLLTRLTGTRTRTPVLMLVIALGVTDLLFAFDSIPAIFGLTRDPFLVFSANVFALLGLRHLYFLAGGLLSRLIYLPAGLAVVLAFIGAKLIGQALRASGVTRIAGVPVPGVSAWQSLLVIVLVLGATAAASVAATRRSRARPAAGPAQQTQPGQQTELGQPARRGRTSGRGEGLPDVGQDV